jgi:hypothetical protein
MQAAVAAVRLVPVLVAQVAAVRVLGLGQVRLELQT